MKRLIYILFVVAVSLVAASCSTKKNTASTRRWQAFVTRYNVYFNAEQAYIEGLKAQDKGLQENYTERLPLFGVGYEKQRQLGGGSFENSILKCEKAIQLHSIKKKPVVSGNKAKSPQQKAYLSRKEFNPFLKNAWLLMGKAQFEKGDLSEAASTFSYITRFYAAEPAVVAEARIWLARCYAELDWLYDAEDVIQRIDRDTVPARLSGQRALTMADYYLRQDKLEEALPYLQRVVKKEKSKARKARQYYLLGQTLLALDRPAEAYKAFGKCIAQSSTYEMSFHARIQQTEALTNRSNVKSMVKRLKRMTRSDNNKDYLDQIYYAIGNIHMQQADTLSAISAYETGRAKATKKGVETAMLLLRLGGIYWDQRRFDKAQPCYTEAIGLIDKEYNGYKEVTRRSKVLDALVPPTSAIQLQDSLQWLASLDDAQRNAAIDRVIEALKKKEAEEKKARRDSMAEARQRENSGGPGANDRGAGPDMPSGPANMGGGSQDWYFYNQQLVMQGKQAFQKTWGNRKNDDDWRRSNRTVIASNDNIGYDYEAEDSIAAAREAVRDSLLATGMSEKDIKRWMRSQENGDEAADDDTEKKDLDPKDDPHEREYYMAQIPFTPEAKAASDSIIRESLFEAAVIEKDQLEDFALAAETFGRLERQFPDFGHMDEATYHLFLLYSRWAEITAREGHDDLAAQYKVKAESYRERLRNYYPNYEMTPIVCDPDFERNARYGREIEDALYTETYDAYRQGHDDIVERNYATSTAKFPHGANRPKFIFVHALSRLGKVPADTITAELRSLASEFPKSDVAEMAGMIVNGLEAGRTIGSGGFDLGSLWARRTAETKADNAAAGEDRALSPDRDVPFVFLVAYKTGDVKFDDNLLYNLARFNFSTYVFRGFDISKERDKDLTQFRVSGFRDFDDVHGYAQRIFRDKNVGPILRGVRVELISEKNLQKLGSLYSFEDYRHFYDSCYVPLDINPDLPLEYAPEDEIEGIEYEEASPEDAIIYRPAKQQGATESGAAGQPADAPATVDDNGDPILDDDPLRPVVRDDDYISDDEFAPVGPKKSDDEFIMDDAPAAPSKAAADDYISDDEFAPVGPKTSDDEFIMDDAPAAPSKAAADDYISDDEFAPVGPEKSDDEFIMDDAPAAPSKAAADDYIIDDERPGGAKKTNDDEFIFEDAPAAKKKTQPDDYILDEETKKPAAKTDDDEETYAE